MIVIINLRWIVPLILVAGACSASPESDGLAVMATTSILGDVTERLVGEVATVEVLIPAEADPHGFQPSARQAASLRDVDVVFANGLGLEAGLTDVLDAARRDGVLVVEVGPEVEPIAFSDNDNLDPHFWLDPMRMSRAAALITNTVADLAEPERAQLLSALASFQADLAAIDEEIAGLLAGVTNRKLVTNHDSLGYFADRYGFQVVGTVVPGGSTLASPSPRDVADLIEIIEDEQIAAVFTDAAEPDSLAQLVADESRGFVEVVELYIGALGPIGSGAAGYLEMLQLNAERISGALS